MFEMVLWYDVLFVKYDLKKQWDAVRWQNTLFIDEIQIYISLKFNALINSIVIEFIFLFK